MDLLIATPVKVPFPGLLVRPLALAPNGTLDMNERGSMGIMGCATVYKTLHTEVLHLHHRQCAI